MQVARAGRFGTKGLAITFVSDENDAKILNDVQERFEVNITELPDEIDISSYSKKKIGLIKMKYLHFTVNARMMVIAGICLVAACG